MLKREVKITFPKKQSDSSAHGWAWRKNMPGRDSNHQYLSSKNCCRIVRMPPLPQVKRPLFILKNTVGEAKVSQLNPVFSHMQNGISLPYIIRTWSSINDSICAYITQSLRGDRRWLFGVWFIASFNSFRCRQSNIRKNRRHVCA